MNREKILCALFAILAAIPDFKTSGRRLPKTWKEVTNQPALFMINDGGKYPPREARGLPAKISLPVELILLSNAGSDPDVAGIIELNNLVDIVEAALTPPPGIQVQTLGGLVSHCWIEGDIEIRPGDMDSQGQGLAKIPLGIIVNV